VAAGGSITVHVTSATSAASCGDYDNTASFTTTNDGSGNASDSTTVVCPVGITLDKTTENGTTFHVGDTVQYAFLVALASPDDVPLGNVTLTDDTGICDSAPTFDSGDTNGNSLLDQGETWKFTCSHVVTANDPSLIHNVATVQGTSADERTVTATDDQDVTVIHPAIKIVKTVDPQSGNPGDTVTYTYVVTNVGDTTLYKISVDDDVIGHIGFIAQLDPGESVTLTKDFVLPAGNPLVKNVGTATGTDVLGEQVSDDDDAFVTIVEAENPPPPTAFTGSDAARLGLIAGVLVALGLLGLALGRRRREA
jgi:ethanolamine utilization microcompartment shell protein EutS